MSTDMKIVFLDHNRRYPKMETQDFLKLVYQNTFGPKHFSPSPGLDEVCQGIEEELAIDDEGDSSPIIEDLGGEFVRVSLSAIRMGKITVDELAIAFQKSFAECPPLDKKSMKVFNDRVNVFLALTQTKEIERPAEEIDGALQDLFVRGIRPVRHSLTYHETYHPHYRVIHTHHLPTLR